MVVTVLDAVGHLYWQPWAADETPVAYVYLLVRHGEAGAAVAARHSTSAAHAADDPLRIRRALSRHGSVSVYVITGAVGAMHECS